MLNEVTMLTVRDSANFDQIVFRGIFANRADAIAEGDRIIEEYQSDAEPLFRNAYWATVQGFAVHM